MSENQKTQALHVWHSLLDRPENRRTAPEQYEELLRLAEGYWKHGVINRAERKVLIIEATERYARTIDNGRLV